MDFYLFLLVTAALFLRPQDLVPSLASFQIYEVLIVGNLLVAGPAIVAHFRAGWRNLPATGCVLGIFAALVLSLLVRAETQGALHWGIEFAKVAAFFFLAVSVLNTPKRLLTYLVTVGALTVVLAGLAVAHFHGQLDLSVIRHAREIRYDTEGFQVEAYRLAAYGVFADPNDLSMMIVLSMFICLGGLLHRRLGGTRIWLIVPLLFLGYALSLTQSRGGLLALLAGLASCLVSRYGWARSGLALTALVPLLLLVYDGRQSDIHGGIATGTGSQRTDLWYAGLQMMKWEPLFGIGHGRFVEEQGLVAHSSYIQALAEWGPIGGTLFLGLFYIAAYSLWRLKRHGIRIASPTLRSLQPFMFGGLIAYAAAMLTLSRCDVVPTYLVAGLAMGFDRVARQRTNVPPVRWSTKLAAHIVLATIGFLLVTYIYIRFIYRLFGVDPSLAT